MVTAIYAGSFDPFTNGHKDIVLRSISFCSKLIIGVGNNSSKKTFFSIDERINLIKLVPCIQYELSQKVSVKPFDGLLVDFAKKCGANLLVRGIRSVSDFEYEINLANINKTISGIDTVFLPTSPDMAVVSSSMVKEIAKHGGDVSRFVDIHINNALKARFGFSDTESTTMPCPNCNSYDSLKMTEDKPSFCYCRRCGVVVPV